MANSKELKALIVLAGKIDPSLQTAMLKASGESMKLANRTKQSAKEMGNLSNIIKGTFVGSIASNAVSSLTSKLWELSTGGIKLASDLKEVQNVVDVTFVQGAGQINEWAKTTKKAFGLSELQAKQYSGTLGATFKSSGVAQKETLVMSKNLTSLAGDLASFRNLSQDDAFTKIMSGMAGETEPLRQIGINMSVANLEAYALSKGIKTSYAKMDQASQTLLRYNYLMENTKDAQGDFARTINDPANQSRLFDTNLKQLSATLSQKALPYFNELLQTGNRWMENVDIEQATARVASTFETMGNMIQWTRDNSNWLIPVISGVAGSLTALQIISTISGLYKAWTATTFAQTWAQQGLNIAMKENPIGLVVTGIGLLVAAGLALWQNWDTVIAKAKDLWAWLSKVTEPVRKFFSLGSDGGSGNAQSLAMQGFASGGVATRPSIFGEAGPEMAIPLQRTSRSIGLLNQTARILGAGGSGGTSVVYAPVIQGGSGPDVQRALDSSFEQFKSWSEEYFGDKGRTSFG